ncbi:MAG: imidazole glycerol phosphate synthase subunit HisH [Sedimentisphaerales bacterium]|nr:imidazole glycerol phosphate synthase subunit HisH [Sedimentisphaerales bacterium]
MIGIIDYGMGNLHSVHKGFEKVGAQVEIITRPDQIADSEKIVLPGVGAFRDAIDTLHQKDLVEPILQFIREGKWFLGICLGLQLLFDKSYEDGEYEGLGVIPGEVVRFDFTGRPDEGELKIPHMGWNALAIKHRAPIYQNIEDGTYVYFVHSYYVAPVDESVIATTTEHGVPFVSSIWRDNVMATQFHPEKSQQLGLQMLKNFAAL